ncbi:MAG: hypothetical protein Q4G24_03335 [Paracoccus sp. (in: a-proteobacteria)]|uniref:hypothetical protein n=1 Tax=Paracoccus sp. TaxID=267 RepID=UPI0026E03F6D|nr:hypothetical protein [Paracoccus sp. (in: a-proteobacteria)]MDO5620484.1 hypothetical protein [Paracoccus sp. (in: a-proteobacteria)]
MKPVLIPALTALFAMTGCAMPDNQAMVEQLTAQPQVAPVQAGADPIVMTNNHGGNVMQMVSTRNQLAQSGREVQLRGACSSACTILITLPNACLGPNARIGFHAPRLPGTQVIPPMVDQIMAQYYRNGILDRWNNEWKAKLDMTYISAAEYVRLDPQTRICT